MQPPDQARVLMDHSIIAAYAGRRWKKTAVGRHYHTPSNPEKKTFSLCLPTIHCAAAVYFSCFSLSSALIQSSFFNVISVKLLPFGKIRSLAGASGCAVSIEPYPSSSSRSLPSLISKVSLKITSGGKVFKRHRKTWLLDEIKKWCWLLLLCNRFLPPTRRCTK